VPDERQLGNGQPRRAAPGGGPGDDPAGVLRIRLAGWWALVLGRFRDETEPSTGRLPGQEGGADDSGT
jgi:hypothetical protein